VRQFITWLDAKWRTLLIGVGLLIGFLWWARKDAVDDYKDKRDEDANRRAKDADDAARDASKLSATDRGRLLDKKGWYRD